MLISLIQNALSLEYSKGQFINAIEHVWGYFKNCCSNEEKTLFIFK